MTETLNLDAHLKRLVRRDRRAVAILGVAIVAVSAGLFSLSWRGVRTSFLGSPALSAKDAAGLADVDQTEFWQLDGDGLSEVVYRTKRIERVIRGRVRLRNRRVVEVERSYVYRFAFEDGSAIAVEGPATDLPVVGKVAPMPEVDRVALAAAAETAI